MNYNLLNTPIDYLKGLGVNRSDLIKKELKIFNYKDLVNLFPNRYIDKSKYYKPHSDSVQFTCLIWMYKEPKQFFGGNLKLSAAKATIECVSNRMVFFPSYLEHEVTEVKSKDDIKFGHGRYCITHFYNWVS